MISYHKRVCEWCREIVRFVEIILLRRYMSLRHEAFFLNYEPRNTFNVNIIASIKIIRRKNFKILLKYDRINNVKGTGTLKSVFPFFLDFYRSFYFYIQI